jgi:hypothetical protein
MGQEINRLLWAHGQGLISMTKWEHSFIEKMHWEIEMCGRDVTTLQRKKIEEVYAKWKSRIPSTASGTTSPFGT